MNKYSDAQIADIIALRLKGNTWEAVARKFAVKYNVETNSENMRNTYRRHRHIGEIGNDAQVIKNLQAIARARNTSSLNAKENRALVGALNTKEDVIEAVRDALACISLRKAEPIKKKTAKKGEPLTVELLFSDWQIGKLMEDYNTEIAIKRLQKYTESAIFKIKQYQKLGYKVERIVLAMLGDIIESSEKHKNSARATDTSTPAQIQNSIENLYKYLIVPLGNLQIEMDVICVTGNHDWNDHGINMFYPGREHYSWIIYKTLELLSKEVGFNWMNYNVAEGCFAEHQIYGHTIVYEHGVGVNVDHKKMQTRADSRAKQLQKHVTYFRMGDKHNVSRFNEDTLVCNGAFFGGDSKGVEYSGINCYTALAGQIMFAYVPRKDERLPIFDSFVIQLQHVK